VTRAFIFKNRGALLAIPAALLAIFGKPSAFSVAAGLPLAFAGELLRCWAVGYSGVTTREGEVIAPELATGGPYSFVRNPLYLGNFMTALGFTIAYTGGCTAGKRFALRATALGIMAGTYATIVPHEEDFLRERFGEAYVRYCESVPRIVPLLEPADVPRGEWKLEAVAQAESRTFVTFGAMLAVLALKALYVKP